jgi:dihydrofolate reductase
MRALRYYLACTADGFIAHADGSFDGFLLEGEHVADFLESYKWFDTVLMGRKTYEVGLREGKTNPYPMKVVPGFGALLEGVDRTGGEDAGARFSSGEG